MSTKPKRLIVIATGGTGGHVFPAQALAEEMLNRGWRVKVWLDKRVEALTNNFPKETQLELIPSKSFAQPTLLAKCAVPLILLWSLMLVLGKNLKDRPACMVGFGSYASFTPLFSGMLLRIPSAIHEQNGNMGVVNRFFAQKVQLVASGSHNPEFPSNANAKFTGNPIRGEVLSRLGRVYNFPHEGKINVLIVGGSQGALLFDNIIPETILLLPENLRKRLTIFQQVREENIPKVNEKYKHLGIGYTIKPFFEDIPDLMANAHLIIARAGASSIAEITTMGLPAILVPFAGATNDHQTINAQALVNAGAAIMVKEENFDPAVLSDAMSKILLDSEKISQMADTSKNLGVSDAAHRLADLVENLGHRGKN